MIRNVEKLSVEEHKKKMNELKDDLLVSEKIVGGIIFLGQISISNNQDRNYAGGRHNQDLFRGEIFIKILDLFDLMGEVPNGLMTTCGTHLMRVFKSIVEQSNFHDNVAEYIGRFRICFNNLKGIFGNTLPKLRTLQHILS